MANINPVHLHDRKKHPRGRSRPVGSSEEAEARLTRRQKFRKSLVIEGRRLVIFDLGGGAGSAPDENLAHRHQEMVLGEQLQIQPHTWFKTVVLRAHHGWDAAQRERLTVGERQLRLAIAKAEI